MGKPKLHINLPLEAFILKLKKEGFDVDVTTHLHIQKILLLFKDELEQNPSKLKSLLCPVISRSQEEQIKFNEIFDSYFTSIEKQVQTETEKKPSFPEIGSLLKQSDATYSKLLLAMSILLAASLFCYALYVLRIDRIDPDITYQQLQNRTDASLLVGDTLLFHTTVNPKTGQQLYWDFGDSTFISDSLSYLHKYERPGLYTVHLERSYRFVPFSDYHKKIDLCVCESKPKADFEYQSSTNQKGGTKLRLSFHSKITYPYPDKLAYRWDFGDGTSSTEKDPIHEYQVAGDFDVILVVTDSSQYPRPCQSDQAGKQILLDDQEQKASVDKHIPDKAIPTKEIIVTQRMNGILWVITPFLLYTLLEFYLFWRRRFRPSKAITLALKGGDKPPYEIPFPSQNNKIYQEKDQHELAHRLRQRIRMISELIDVKETVTSTLKNSGFPILRYKFSSKPPEYLFLIDKSSVSDQYALLTQYLTNALTNEGVLLDTFYYRFDPRICHNDQFPDGITLDKLKDKFPDHKLVIVGNGHQFLHKKKATVQPWMMEELGEWKEKVLLSTNSRINWNYREKILQSHIPLLSADLSGYMEILDALQENYDPVHSTDTKTLSFTKAEDIATFLSNEPLFQWVCSLAIYPKINWEILLTIGNELSSYYKSKEEILEVSYSNLYQIGHIVKACGGEFSDELRQELLSKMNPSVERISRKALVNLLESIQLPSESFLSEELETQKLYNNFILNPTNKEYAGNVFHLLQKKLITDKVYKDYFTLQTNTIKDKPVGIYFKPFSRFSIIAVIIRLLIFCFFFSIYLAILIPNLLKNNSVKKTVPSEAAILNNSAVDLYQQGNIDPAKKLFMESIASFEKEKDTNAIIPHVNLIKLTYNTAVDFYDKKKYKHATETLDTIRSVSHAVIEDVLHLNGLCAYYLKNMESAKGWYESLYAINKNYFENKATPNLRSLLFEKKPKGQSTLDTIMNQMVDQIGYFTPPTPIETTKTRPRTPLFFLEKNTLYPVSTNNSREIILIPDNVKRASCLLWQDIEELLISDSTTIEFSYSTYDDDGSATNLLNSADGITVHLGRDKNTYANKTPPKGGKMTFINDGIGYGLFFKIFENRGIYLTDGNGKVLKSKSFDLAYTYGKYHAVKIILYKSVLTVYIDGQAILVYEGMGKLQAPGIAIGASTGDADAEHRIKNVDISVHLPAAKEHIINKWFNLNTYYDQQISNVSSVSPLFSSNFWKGTYQVQIKDQRENKTEWIYFGKLQIEGEKIYYSFFPEKSLSESTLGFLKWNDPTNKSGYLFFDETSQSISGELKDGSNNVKILRAVRWE